MILTLAGIMIILAGILGVKGDDSGAIIAALVAIYAILLEIALNIKNLRGHQ